MRSPRGFTLLESILVLFILLGLVLISSYSLRAYQIKQNIIIAKQALLDNVTYLESFYLKNGSYLIVNGASVHWPLLLDNQLALGNQAYLLSFYPPYATLANNEAYCLVATPNPTTIQAHEEVIYSDRYGNLSNQLPANCENYPN